MSSHTKTGLAILRIGSVAAICADILLQDQDWGINFSLCLLVCAIASEAICRATSVERTAAGRTLPWLVPLFAAGFAWRGSSTLCELDLFAIAVIGVVSAVRGRAGSILSAPVTEYPLGLIRVGMQSLLGIFGLAKVDIKWDEIPQGQSSRRGWVALRGAMVATPMLLVFGALFAQADPEFRELAGKLFNWDPATVCARLAWTGVFFIGIAGALRSLLIANWQSSEEKSYDYLKLGCGEGIVALALVNALFFAFVTVQVRFLFGGEHAMHQVAGMGYKDYARGGFFELLWVTALVLPALLLLDWAKQAPTPGQKATITALNVSLIALLFVIMASAIQRLNLYIAQCGLTELRLYSSIFMGWLAILFCWYIATVLTGRRDRFAIGAVVSGLAVIAGMHVANPAQIIVRADFARIRAGHPMDARYFVDLGADAVPDLVANLATIQKPDQRSDVASRLLEQWGTPAKGDWRSWNYAEAVARAAVQGQRKQLASAVIAPPPCACGEDDAPCKQTAVAAVPGGGR